MLSIMESIVAIEAGYRDDLLRAEKGRLDWTDQDIADRAGLSVPTVRTILRGETNVLFVNVEKVAHALGLTMQQVCSPRSEPAGV
jgi:transcriptional regulator with XRE-family HTH domain